MGDRGESLLAENAVRDAGGGEVGNVVDYITGDDDSRGGGGDEGGGDEELHFGGLLLCLG